MPIQIYVCIWTIDSGHQNVQFCIIYTLFIIVMLLFKYNKFSIIEEKILCISLN